MSIEIIHRPWFAAVALGAFAILLAAVLGAFRASTVLGPKRLRDDDSLLRAWVIPVFVISIGLFAQSAYVLGLHGSELKELENDPKARAAWRLPPRDEIALAALTPAIWIAVMAWGDCTLIRDGIRKLGYGMRMLGAGIGYGILGAFVALPLTAAASELCQWLSIHFQFAQPEEHQLLTLLHSQPSHLLKGLIVLAAVIGAPVAEEMLFRGHLQTLLAQTLRQAMKVEDSVSARWLAILIASAVFAGIHANGVGSLWMLPPLFLLAVCFGYVYERTGNLWASVVMHAVFNSASIIVALSSMAR